MRNLDRAMSALLKFGIRFLFAAVAIFIGYVATAAHRAGQPVEAQSFAGLMQVAVVYAVLTGLYDVALRADRTPWRFASIRDALLIARSTSLAALTFVVIMFLVGRATQLPRSALFLTFFVDLAITTGARVVARALHERSLASTLLPFLMPQASNASSGKPVLLIGSIDQADGFLRDVARGRRGDYLPVGVMTLGKDKLSELQGIPVYQQQDNFSDLVERLRSSQGLDAVLFLDENTLQAPIPSDEIGRLRASGLQFLKLSKISEIGDGGLNPSTPQITQMELEDLLCRPPVKLDYASVRELVSAKRILVTGAGGSIGSEICRQVSALGCAHISLVDQSEFLLFNIDHEIGRKFPTLSRREILCDVRNAERLSAWIQAEQPDIVFHAAALKHVPLVESHPCEGILTNICGTWNVAEACRAAGVAQMVFISTDKAVEPTNVMGATKRIAEAAVRANQDAASQTRFSVVRFGNVLGSAGSVVPIFKDQIARGGPVTLTHPDVERYFMTIPEAVQLVLHATATSSRRVDKRASVFVLDMGKPVKIMDLARRLIELHGKTPGRDIEIKITGLRPGEKLTEELVDTTEESFIDETGVMEVVDKLRVVTMNRRWIERLEVIGKAGNSVAARDAVFDALDHVRGVRQKSDVQSA